MEKEKCFLLRIKHYQTLQDLQELLFVFVNLNYYSFEGCVILLNYFFVSFQNPQLLQLIF
jgi:hypothetical protein